MWKDALNGLQSMTGFFVGSFKRTPLFVWVYMGLMVWLYRRMVRDFLKTGTSTKKLLGRSVKLTVEEETVAEGLIDPAKLQQSFNDVGGLTEAKEVLQEHVVWPFVHPEMYSGSLSTAPSGVLLYGPPGTGKTLLARALAKELNSSFISVSVEKMFSKYVGESEKLVAAVFTLAKKMQPSVIFVDEIDSLLSQRTSTESEAYSHAKTIFLTHWDGINSGSNVGDKIIVVGATNRMEALDEAVLRRLSVRLEVPPPDMEGRRHILQILLTEGGVILGDDVDLDQVAASTNGYSGSDLKELCKVAAVLPMREVLRGGSPSVVGGAKAAASSGSKTPPPLRMVHLNDALKRVKPTPQAEFRTKQNSPAAGNWRWNPRGAGF